MGTIHKIFFDPNQLGLVFSIAAILRRIGDKEISIFIAVRPKNLAKEKDIQGLIYDLPVNGVLENAGNDKIYLVGIGPSNPEEEDIMLDFIARHGSEIAVWIDNHTWSEGAWETARQSCLMKKYTSSGISALLSLDYRDQIQLDWQMIERTLSSTKECVVFSNPVAKKYFLALEVAWVISQNIKNNYYIETFWSIVKEIADSKSNSEISCLADLGQLMRQEASEAISRISGDCPYFAEAKAMGRPVGYLKLGEVGEYTDITGILDEGLKAFPWLVLLDYSINGKEIFSGDSKEIDIDEILNFYFTTDINKEDVLKAINAEIVRRVTA
jgi:hypothetical protein